MEECVRELMMLRHNIRNLSVIADVDHGKTTLTDSLLSKAGVIAAGQAGDKCHTDNTKMEQERGITIKSTWVEILWHNGPITSLLCGESTCQWWNPVTKGRFIIQSVIGRRLQNCIHNNVFTSIGPYTPYCNRKFPFSLMVVLMTAASCLYLARICIPTTV